MARQQREHDDLDREAWARAHTQFERLQTTLPAPVVSNVAREVVRRLAFRMPRFGHDTSAPDDAEITRFCASLTASQEEEAERFILNLRRSGNSVSTIYLSYIAAAARELGRQWDEDEISFALVTMASGRLYRIIRGLRHVLDQDGKRANREDRVLLTLLPGDNHTLASEIAADIFRRAGWDVDLSVGEDHDSVVARAETTAFAAVMIVANTVDELEQLTRLVIGLRIVAPMAPVVLAGKILSMPDVADLSGVDAVIDSLESAAEQLHAIVGNPATHGRDHTASSGAGLSQSD